MKTLSFTQRHRQALLGLVVAATALTAASVQAGTVSYADITGTGFIISNISESNDLAGNVALYGQPSLAPNGTSIVFNASAHPFTANAANGSSSFLRGVLDFTVTYTTPPTNTPNIQLTESGTFYGVGDAYATVTPFLFLFSADSVLLGSATGAVTPTDPFLGGAGNTQQAFTWQGTVASSNGNPINTFNVVLDNDLSAVSLSQGSSAQVDKKLVTIDVCPDCTGATPEPASLGILGLGGLALLLRGRRK